MKKTTRVSLLVFTIIAAIIAFGALWYTRPGAPSYVIDEAKARQEVPLLEVQEPATQTPPVKVDIDYDKVTQTVKDSLIVDESFNNEVATKVSSSVNSYVDANVTSIVDKESQNIKTEFDSKLASNKRELLSSIDKLSRDLESFETVDVEEYKSELESIRGKVDGLLISSSRMGDTNVDISTYVPQIVDSILPQVTDKVLMEIEKNKKDILSDLYALSDDAISSDEVEQIYVEYRDNVILDLTPIILDNIEMELSSKLDSFMANSSTTSQSNEEVVTEPVKTEDLSSSIVETKETVLEEKMDEAKEIETKAIVPKAPSFSTTSDGPSIVNQQSFAESPSMNISIQPEISTETVSVPSFSNENDEVIVMTPEEYEEQRASIREDAINNILNKLN